jgi:hypothetical protein
VDLEAAKLAEKLTGAKGSPDDGAIRATLAKWALSPKIVCEPPGKPRFSVTQVDVRHEPGEGPYGLLETTEHRVVETATGRVVLHFQEIPDVTHPWDPTYASLQILEDDGVNVIVCYEDNNRADPRYVVFGTTTVPVDYARRFTLDFHLEERVGKTTPGTAGEAPFVVVSSPGEQGRKLDLQEHESDTHHDVVDRRTGRIVLAFRETRVDHASGSSVEGVRSIEIVREEASFLAVVRYHGRDARSPGHEVRVCLPG